MKAKAILITIFVLMVISTLTWQINIAESGAVTDGLVSYWSFDKDTVSAKSANDVWGKNHGTIVGKLKAVQGKIGEALEFDGTLGTNYVDCGNDASLSFPKGEFTLEAWIYETGAGVVLGKGSGGDAQTSEYLWFADAALGFWWRNAWHIPKGYDFSTQKVWMHGMAVASDGGKALRFYKNGDLMATDTAPGAMPTTGVFGLAIGMQGLWGATNNFAGIIDEVRIYNRALSDAEVKQNFSAQGLAAVFPAGKLALTWGEIKVSR